MNTFGTRFRLTTFGESHGAAIGGVIDGFPSGIAIDLDFIQAELDRRRPGQSLLTTARKESDKVEILSGIFEGRSTGCPIGFIVRNENQHSSDYDNLRNLFRPSHADFTYQQKYVCATTEAVGVRLLAKPFRALLAVLLPNSCCDISAYK
jgi:chorismate synthase